MRKHLCWIVGWILIFSLAACSPSMSDTGEPKDSTPAKEKEVDEEVKKLSPLTGEPIMGEEHPVIMVMINNHRHARPQTGLDLADVVVEILAEGGITRYAAFYHSVTDGTVGPVRSVRNYYLDLAEGANAVVAHAGGAKDALTRIQHEKYPSLDGIHADSRYFTRVSFRKAPHNLYTDLERLNQAVKEKGYDSLTTERAYHFTDTAATEQGQPADQIDLIYHHLYKAGYKYDNASHSYIRYTEGERQADRETENPLSMQNVLVVFTDHQIISSAGHRAVDVKGSGKGYLFQRGKGMPVEWKYRDGWLIPFADGQEISLLPGKTWINVLPETGRVSFR